MYNYIIINCKIMALFLPKVQAFGIDLSDLSIKIGQAKKKGSKYLLTSLSKREIPEGFINDGVINEDKEEGSVCPTGPWPEADIAGPFRVD